MIFIGFILCMISSILIFLKLKYVLTGKLVEGEVIGYVRGAKGLYGFEGYNYRIRLEYKGRQYDVTSMEGITVTVGTIPKKNLGMQCLVYFNPKSEKGKVVLKGFYQLDWIAVLLFILGALSIIIEIMMLV
ncbi:DUF3592 domain-containing protein [Halalkalibacter sp. APA_J-10(15)]|uniref:DUF3592 domain-containing protein n=1 Tax=Halalkalibacter sp. APA_J-10(15) TaxID=2933805 RepID=UPI001FF27E7A|nr:DUF3592 domain-containing protein [Halalkalibacter sp. APA_J-10(15)]MCK0471650.1 DUF3592 domain-containing protein [Halalkalibacter sp. APA_J-10(15)]